MYKILTFLLSTLLLTGCATSSKTYRSKTTPSKPIQVIEVVESEPSKEAGIGLENIKKEKLEKYAQKNGVIFAKTDFQGVLKTSYVKLDIQNLEDEAATFQLYIAGDSDEQTFPWEVEAVEPGYFFIELPAGQYKISSISIPVGTTLATEETNIQFQVIPAAITYVGTLRVVGTKEKLKLGGVPLIKPGFEYAVDILDERDEGVETFLQRYPDMSNEVLIKIMQLVS